MPNAARVTDPIGHSPTMNWLLKGLLIGAAVGVAAVAIAGTGGLAAAAVIGGMAAGGAGIGEVLSTMSWAPKEKAGMIVTGSMDVITNNLFQARAHVDVVMCSKHPTLPPIATGSATVLINCQPAARINDNIVCGGVIMDGSPNVIIGGETAQTDIINAENLVPGWVHNTLLAVGLASATILAGPVVAVAGLIGGMAGGAGGEWLGGKLFGEGSDGQKWMMLGGSFIGGAFGAKGGLWFEKNYTITTQGLGSNLGNVRIVRKPPALDNYRGRYNAQRYAEGKPRLPSDYDAHHRIPQRYQEHSEFQDFDFHQPNNIKGVKGARSDTNVHQDITNEWENFHKSNPSASRGDIESFANYIDQKYSSHWFE